MVETEAQKKGNNTLRVTLIINSKLRFEPKSGPHITALVPSLYDKTNYKNSLTQIKPTFKGSRK